MSTWPARFLIALVRTYRLLLSPWLGNACRFEPTCSAYAIEALSRHGAAAGTALTLGRLARCQPWCAAGHDPVPVQRPRFLSSLLPGAAGRAASSSNVSDSASP